MFENYYWFNKTNQRFYTITVHQDMLNDIVLTHTWGGRHSRKGHYKHLVVSSRKEVEQHVLDMMKRRCKRGYDFILQ